MNEQSVEVCNPKKSGQAATKDLQQYRSLVHENFTY